MRVFFTILFIVSMFAFNANSQTGFVQTAFERGITNAHAGQFEKALTDFEIVLVNQQISNKTSAAFLAKINYNIGVCLFRLNRSTDAVSYLTKSIQLSKNNYRNAFYVLAMAHIELQNWQAAKDAFRRSIKLQKGDDGESWFDLGRVYLHEADYKNAAVAFQNAIRGKSVDAATAHNNIGVISAMNGDWHEAEKQFETALAMSGGKLQVAQRNLEFCRSNNFKGDLVAKLEFIKNKNLKAGEKAYRKQ